MPTGVPADIRVIGHSNKRDLPMTSFFHRASMLAGAAAFAVALMPAAPARAGDDVTILRCSADGAGDISLSVRYVQRVGARRTRKTFSAEFEARAGGAYQPGQSMEVLVGARVVGSIALKVVPATADIGAEFKLDTNSTPGDVALPFPSNLRIVDNTNVRVRINGVVALGCRVH